MHSHGRGIKGKVIEKRVLKTVRKNEDVGMEEIDPPDSDFA